MTSPGKALREGRTGPLPDPKAQAIARTFMEFADVRMPHEAEEPILGPEQRRALREFLLEVNETIALKAVGVKPRRSALLYGPPGGGKTTFAHHFAARLGMPLISVRSEAIISKYVGETGQNLGKLFDAIEKSEGKVVIFLDEIDSMGGSRETEGGAASADKAAALTVMLRRMDKTEAIVLAATNRKDILDAALWRRFGMQIEIGLPDDDERYAIIKRYAAPFDLPEEDVDFLTDATAGASPALIQQLIEGVKRATVMAPKSGRVLENARDAFVPVISSIAPPPRIDPPILWTPDGRDVLDHLSWPWQRPAPASEAA